MNMRNWMRASGVVAVGLLVCFAIGPVVSQDPSLKPGYGEVTLKAGFEPDPHVKVVEAGGDVETKEGGLTAWVAKAPDYRLKYTAGKYVLTIKAECADEDTTLHIRTPDGKWIANDDGPDTGLNPLIRFQVPQSGQYDIWVGTLKQGVFPKTKLIITELK